MVATLVATLRKFHLSCGFFGHLFSPPVFGRGYVSTQFVLKPPSAGVCLPGRTGGETLRHYRSRQPRRCCRILIVWGAKAKPPVFSMDCPRRLCCVTRVLRGSAFSPQSFAAIRSRSGHKHCALTVVSVLVSYSGSRNGAAFFLNERLLAIAYRLFGEIKGPGITRPSSYTQV